MPNNNEMSLSQSAEPAKKAVYAPMSEQLKLEAVAHLTDDVLAALTKAFFEVVKREQWGKRDLAQISGLNETGIGHILAGRRKNLTIETIALLARAMRKRPELVLHDLRPRGNQSPAIQTHRLEINSAAAALQEQQFHQRHSATLRLWEGRSSNASLRELLEVLE